MNSEPTNLTINLTLATTAVLSAIAAVVSALLASQANRNTTKGDRERRERELSHLANRVLATSTRCDGLANDLKQTYRSSAVMEGVYGGSRHLGRVREKFMLDLASAQANARHVEMMMKA
jgi:hypothetical protein